MISECQIPNMTSALCVQPITTWIDQLLSPFCVILISPGNESIINFEIKKKKINIPLIVAKE